MPAETNYSKIYYLLCEAPICNGFQTIGAPNKNCMNLSESPY